MEESVATLILCWRRIVDLLGSEESEWLDLLMDGWDIRSIATLSQYP